MKQTSEPVRKPAEAVIKDIRRATRRQFSSEEKIRIVLEGLRGEDSIAELCRREGIRIFRSYVDILDLYCDARDKIIAQPWHGMSIGLRRRARVC